MSEPRQNYRALIDLDDYFWHVQAVIFSIQNEAEMPDKERDKCPKVFYMYIIRAAAYL